MDELGTMIPEEGQMLRYPQVNAVKTLEKEDEMTDIKNVEEDQNEKSLRER